MSISTVTVVKIHVHIDGNLVSISAEVKNEKEIKEGEKLLRSERIQDGVERIEFAAGEAAVRAGQDRDDLLAGGAYVQQEDALRDAPPQAYATINALMANVLDSLVADGGALPRPASRKDAESGAATPV